MSKSIKLYYLKFIQNHGEDNVCSVKILLFQCLDSGFQCFTYFLKRQTEKFISGLLGKIWYMNETDQS